MLNKCNISRTGIVCLCLALVGCILPIRPTGSAPAENKLEDCRPRKQNKPASEDECVPELEASLSYYAKFKYDTNCKGITCDYRHECGRAPMNTIRGDKFLPYIINGQPQRYGSWPSFATVRRPHFARNDRGYPMNLFGGVIISPRHILTCDNCLLDWDVAIRQPQTLGGHSNPKPVPKEEISVTVGDHSHGSADRHEKTYQLRDICRAKTWSTNDPKKDFAVLTIDGTIEFDKFKQPACLPYKPDYNPPANKFIHCYLMGVGASREFHKNVTWDHNPEPSPRTYPNQIHDMPVVAKPCRAPHTDSDGTMCFKKLDKPGTICDGDFGSPVLCKNPRSNRWTVVGLVSAGDRGCTKGATDWQFMVVKIETLLNTIKEECGI